MRRRRGAAAVAGLSRHARRNAQVLVEPGDVVLFDSYLPHRSDANATDGWRRSAYITFNRAAEGDFHERYYETKRANLKSGAISLNLDFAGSIVHES